MSDQATSVVWSREVWKIAGGLTDYWLARLCPLCPGEGGTRIIVGETSFMIPFSANADSFTISVPVDGDTSSVAWSPCGHTVTVEARLDGSEPSAARDDFNIDYLENR